MTPVVAAFFQKLGWEEGEVVATVYSRDDSGDAVVGYRLVVDTRYAIHDMSWIARNARLVVGLASGLGLCLDRVCGRRKRGGVTHITADERGDQHIQCVPREREFCFASIRGFLYIVLSA